MSYYCATSRSTRGRGSLSYCWGFRFILRGRGAQATREGEQPDAWRHGERTNQTDGKSTGYQAAEPADGRGRPNGRTQPETEPGSFPAYRPRGGGGYRSRDICH